MFQEKRIRLAIIFSFILPLLIYSGCKKDDPVDPVDTPPTARTVSATIIGQNWASLRGEVDANGISTDITFEYDTTDTFENSITTEPLTIESDRTVTISTGIKGLLPAKTYYYRIKSENSVGTATGSDTSFTTLNIMDSLVAFNSQLSYGTVDDIDGNTYKTIQVGTQTWMAENLRTTALNNGSSIPHIQDEDTWEDLDTLAFCWFETDSSIYGALYNWYAVNTDMLCPDGWSVPAEDDWNTLVDYLGGGSSAGKLLKESGSRHWSYTSSDVTNESGFTALPGGYRNLYGTFGNLFNSGYFWTSTESDISNTAYYRSLYYGYSDVDKGSSNIKAGFSVRCVKDPVAR